MKFDPVKVVHVYYKPMDDKIFVGRLALKNRKVFFEYDASFIETGLNLSPFKFNVLSHNRDDHSKNFSFLMDPKGAWLVSPSYDLTFSSGPSGEHCSMVMGVGKSPGIKQLLELAKISSIKRSAALTIIDEVKSSVSKWSNFAKDSGVSSASSKLVDSAILKIIRDAF